jgi:predicted phosphodiesterase
MWAILSDIHGHRRALEAVIADIGRFPVQRVICLGDIVGEGDHSGECIDLVRDFDVVLRGNWDQDAVRRQPDPSSFECEPDDENPWPARWRYLAGLPAQFIDGDFLFVHGSPRDPTNEYVFPEDVYNLRKMEKIFRLVPRHAFLGHTHVPGVFTHDHRFLSPADTSDVFRLGSSKTLVNVGSVGQPKDGDRRACYVLVDKDVVVFRRVEFEAPDEGPESLEVPAWL